MEEHALVPFSVGLGLDHGSSTSAEDELVALDNTISSVHMDCH